MTPFVHRWSAGQPHCVIVIAHGYGEHAGRYEHVAQRLVDELGAAVYAPTRPAIEHVRGSSFRERIYEGGRHENFNETNRDEVLGDVVSFLREALPRPTPA